MFFQLQDIIYLDEKEKPLFSNLYKEIIYQRGQNNEFYLSKHKLITKEIYDYVLRDNDVRQEYQVRTYNFVSLFSKKSIQIQYE